MSDQSGHWSALVRRHLLVGLLGVVLVVGSVAYVGGRSPWGTKHPRVAHGVAMRANSDNDLVTFEGDGGRRFMFGADHMWWRSESADGEGDPPCLKTPERQVKVDVGFMTVARPEGGSFEHVVWVKCLGSGPISASQ